MKLPASISALIASIVLMVACGGGESGPTFTPVPFLARQLDVKIDPKEAATVLLNPSPLGKGGYSKGMVVTIDILLKEGWQVDEWFGPVFNIDGNTAQIQMDSSQSVAVRLKSTTPKPPAATPTTIPTSTPMPTYTPFPAATPRPTYASAPTPTPRPTPYELEVLYTTQHQNIGGVRADGVLLIVEWTLNNGNSVPIYVNEEDFKLVDRLGQETAISMAATIASLEGWSASLLNNHEVAAGVELRGYSVFDVPAEAIQLMFRYKDGPLVELAK